MERSGLMGDGKSFWLGVAAGAAAGVGLGYAVQRACARQWRAAEGAYSQLLSVQLAAMTS